MSKVAVYVRVSTLDQEKGLKSQEHAIRQYLEGHGIDDAKWFRDRLSGGTTKCPDFDRLQKGIFNGTVKTVICWKLDRLSRSLRDGINVLTDWLEKGVRVVSVTQQLDFSGATGEADRHDAAGRRRDGAGEPEGEHQAGHGESQG